MFIQVPESVNKSLGNGITPRTQIHFPNASLENRDPRAILADNSIHRLRNEMLARRECDCGADRVTMPVAGPNWILWRPPMLPSHESYRRSREVGNNLLLTTCSSPPRRSVTGVIEIQTQNVVAGEEVETPAKEDSHSEEDEIESLESPRSFASSGSNSSQNDMLIQFPEMQSPARGHTPVPKPRSQQSNPWGRASYSDLITMAITSTGNNMMTLSEIYSWIVKNVPYFNDKGTYLSVQGWKNAVRHTLSLRKRFVRVPDPKRPYKSMWTISDDYQRSHFKQKRSHLKSQRGSTEIKQEMRQQLDLDRAMH